MKSDVYTFNLELNWSLLKKLNQIDRFDASWSSLEKVEGDKLKQLKMISTVKSVGASTRIEGSPLLDPDVERLIANVNTLKLEDRHQQEVAGYFQTLDLIAEVFDGIEISTNALKHLHNLLLAFSFKDVWHKGDFKQHSNAVEAHYPDGTSQIIFRTTPPGFETEDAVNKIINWYHEKNDIHPLIRSAVFVYEFVTIHPFQDGNGRLSRLLTTLLLLQTGYVWIQYISFEHEIEKRKSEYYRVLRFCQSNRPHEAIDQWIEFFLDCLCTIQKELSEKMKSKLYGISLAPKEMIILQVIEANPGLRSGEVALKLRYPISTVKRLIAKLVNRELLVKHGRGAGTNYEVAHQSS